MSMHPGSGHHFQKKQNHRGNYGEDQKGDCKKGSLLANQYPTHPIPIEVLASWGQRNVHLLCGALQGLTHHWHLHNLLHSLHLRRNGRNREL